MKDRLQWLRSWIKLRQFRIGDQQQDFRYIYYTTMRTIPYGRGTAFKLLTSMNQNFPEGLSDAQLEAIAADVDGRTSPLKFRNQSILNKLSITQQEVDQLQIGQHMQECAERAERKQQKAARIEQIRWMYFLGRSTKEIAAAFPNVSERTIQRELARIRDISQTEEDRAELARQVVALY